MDQNALIMCYLCVNYKHKTWHQCSYLKGYFTSHKNTWTLLINTVRCCVEMSPAVSGKYRSKVFIEQPQLFYISLSLIRMWGQFSISYEIITLLFSHYSLCVFCLCPFLSDCLSVCPLSLCRALWGWFTFLWTKVRHGTWPSCPLLVTSSSTPSWQRTMRWSSCMLTSSEVSPQRNLTCVLSYLQQRINNETVMKKC